MRRQKRRVYVGGKGTERCIFINMLHNEGLGNQLFIFAAGLTVQQRTGLPLCVIPSSGNPHTKNDYISLFQIPSKASIVTDRASMKPRMNSANVVLNNEDNPMSYSKWTNANIDKSYKANSGKNMKVVERLYQNYSSVEKVIPIVKATLMENEFSKKQSYRDLESATPPKSAYIHVRRGDYIGRNWALNEDYYLRGLDLLNKDPNIEHIWVISNDLDWCKKIDWKSHWSKNPDNIHFFNSENELEVLYKMILCAAGAVVSPSTFSAWGAMMGADRTDKPTIVFPQRWLTHDNNIINALMFPEPKWTKIPNHMESTTTLI